MKPHNKLLEDLARFLLGITGPQALRAYFNGNRAALRRFLRTCKAAGLIDTKIELVRQRQQSETPIVSLRKSEPIPDAEKIAYAANQLWLNEVIPVLVIRGSAKLHTIYGGIHTTLTGNVSHDLALTDVFLAKRLDDAEFTWQLVQSKPGNGSLPDAISADACIELIGRYAGSTVAAKLEMSAQTNLEIW